MDEGPLMLFLWLAWGFLVLVWAVAAVRHMGRRARRGRGRRRRG